MSLKVYFELWKRLRKKPDLKGPASVFNQNTIINS